jgi:hypothetical protein
MMAWVVGHCALAASASPESTAWRNDLMADRMVDRRDRFFDRRTTFWRMRFLAEVILGILESSN